MKGLVLFYPGDPETGYIAHELRQVARDKRIGDRQWLELVVRLLNPKRPSSLPPSGEPTTEQ